MTDETTAAGAAPAAPDKKAEKAAAALRTAIDAGVRAWVDEHIRNGPLARDVTVWNTLHEALPHLGPLIEKEL